MKIFGHNTCCFAFEIFKGSSSILLSFVSAIATRGVFCQIGELKSAAGFPLGEEESLSVWDVSS